MRFKDLTGKKFGLLTVLKQEGNLGGRPAWLCACDCGTQRVFRGGNLRNGASASCGCAIVERVTTHGLHKHPLYGIWQAMIQRCTNPNAKNFHRYGGRGISVAQRWLGEDGFPMFLRDMGERPAGMTLERKDNNGNYEPENCKWASRRDQYRNRSTNNLITFNGQTRTITEWADSIGIATPNLISRIRIYNWPLERALTEPPNRKYRNKRFCE